MLMKKIAIISEFTINSVNYGNHLQAYALKQYISSCYPDVQVESLQVSPFEKKKRTFALYIFLSKVFHMIYRSENNVAESKRVENRYQKFYDFAMKYIVSSPDTTSWEQLIDSDYDVFIVGSDVVWLQYRAVIDRMKFLDFHNKMNARKIAYAASFGRDYIPKENSSGIRKCLKDFRAISVREKSSVDLLKSISVENVVHVCDPTLLLDKKDWSHLESACEFNADKYVFAYMLGDDEEQKRNILEFCRRENLILVTIPFVSGYYNDNDKDFGDIQIINCSPQEWIWLIHHAEYVITDSFHGLVFSTIFEKKFITVSRKLDVNLNNRICDYLKILEEEDKFCVLTDIENIGDKTWDYEKINAKIEELKVFSKQFLDNAIV